jgi:hypothetical protein
LHPNKKSTHYVRLAHDGVGRKTRGGIDGYHQQLPRERNPAPHSSIARHGKRWFNEGPVKNKMSWLGSSRPRSGPCLKKFAASEDWPCEPWTRPLRNAASSLGSCASIYVKAAQFWTTIAGRRPAPGITV